MAKDQEYEAQARAYTRFIVQGGKAVSGWEYAEDAKDELRAMKEEGRLGDAKIVARASLAKYGIDPKRPFTAAPSETSQAFKEGFKEANDKARGKRHESGGNPRTTARASSGRILEFHVYAPDGFESAHRTFEGARRAAQRGASARRMEFKVYRTSAAGFTGAGHGTEVATLLGDVKLKSRIKKLVG